MEFLGSVIHEVECSKGSEMQVMDISGTIGDDGGPFGIRGERDSHLVRN